MPQGVFCNDGDDNGDDDEDDEDDEDVDNNDDALLKFSFMLCLALFRWILFQTLINLKSYRHLFSDFLT